MILTDASVLIDYQRAKDATLTALFDSLPVGVCGTTRSEIVSGGRTPVERDDNIRWLDTLLAVATPEAVWDRIGETIAVLRAAGLRVPYPDVALATLGVEIGVEVWARDQHFPSMAAHLPGLRLFVEPP